MKLTAAVIAALSSLTASLDDPNVDITQSLELLTAYAAAAVKSYLGLSIVVSQSDSRFVVVIPADGNFADDIHTSLHLNVPGPGSPGESPPVEVIFYAASAGAFVDLAADLSWLTGQPATEFMLDQHLDLPPGFDATEELGAESDVNQAIGVLIGRGYTPPQADWQLDALASNNRTDRRTAARHLLDRIIEPDRGHFDVR